MRHVFLTGATGFVGKAILEKILRSFASVESVYLLIRPGKGKVARDRLDAEIISSPIFDTLLKQIGEPAFKALCADKLVVIEGDVTLPGLGISDSDRRLLDNSCIDVVLHCAASVNFDDPIDTALQLNVEGALQMLQLGKYWKVKAYVHVSTAYVGARFRNGGLIQEVISPLDFDVEDTFKYYQEHRDDPIALNRMQLRIQGEFPNTYTLTKAMAEVLVSNDRGDLPMAIVRPSIVGSAWREPCPGWVDVVSAASAVFMASALGLVTVMPGNPRGIASIVPVDTVVNHILRVSSEVYNQPNIHVSHCCSSTVNPCRWRVVSKSTKDAFNKSDMSAVKFTPGPVKFRMLENRDQFNIEWLFRYMLPSWAYSKYAHMSGDKGAITKAEQLKLLTERAEYVVNLFEPFTMFEYPFECTVMKEWKYDEDLPTDIENVFWPRYFQNYAYGLKRFILHQDLIPVEETKNTHGDVSLTTDRLMEWDSDHHHISFPGLIPDISWAFTSRRKPGYTNAGVFGRLLGLTGWKEGLAHEARHIPRHNLRSVQQVKKAVLKSSSVRLAIRASPQEGKQQATAYLNEIASTLEDDPPRAFAWALRKVWRTMFDGIRVEEQGLQALREVCSNSRCPVVLVPSHRSYMDFLMMSFLCFAFNLPVPYIVASTDFLGMGGGLSKLFRDSGAFFLRRNGTFKTDPLYTAVFSEYMKQLLSDGQMVEYYVEGARSRSGKSLEAKHGITQICMDTINEGRVDDVIMVPISLDYEKLVEASMYSSEMLGATKPPETTKNLLTSVLILRKKFGNVSVQFGEHISLKTCSNVAPSVVGKQLLRAIEKTSVCMPIHLVSCLLLMYRHGMSLEQLAASVDWLRKMIHLRGGTVTCIEGEHRVELVRRALKLLDDAVYLRESPKVYQVVVDNSKKKYANIITLSIYRNKIVHFFALEAICMCAVLARKTAVSLSQLHHDVNFLCDLFSKEFVTLNPVINDAIHSNPIFKIKDGTVTLETSREAQREMSLLGSILWPIIDSYFVAASSIVALSTTDAVPLESLLQRMMVLAETWYHDRMILNYESCSVGTLKTAVDIFCRMNIIKILERKLPKLPGKPSRTETMVQLSSTESKVHEFIKRIQIFRRPDFTDAASVANFPLLAKI